MSTREHATDHGRGSRSHPADEGAIAAAEALRLALDACLQAGWTPRQPYQLRHSEGTWLVLDGNWCDGPRLAVWVDAAGGTVRRVRRVCARRTARLWRSIAHLAVWICLYGQQPARWAIGPEQALAIVDRELRLLGRWALCDVLLYQRGRRWVVDGAPYWIPRASLWEVNARTGAVHQVPHAPM